MFGKYGTKVMGVWQVWHKGHGRLTKVHRCKTAKCNIDAKCNITVCVNSKCNITFCVNAKCYITFCVNITFCGPTQVMGVWQVWYKGPGRWPKVQRAWALASICTKVMSV